MDKYLAMETNNSYQTPTMEIFKDYVYLGRTATDYINLIEALKEDSPEKTQERIDFDRSYLGK
jgi:hypothetical protein